MHVVYSLPNPTQTKKGPMLDINLFRVEKGGNPDLIRESQRKRNASVSVVDEIIEIDEQWRKARFSADETNKQANLVQKEIGVMMKAGRKNETAPLMAKKVLIDYS
jgi:seryl-tRNA synthetase